MKINLFYLFILFPFIVAAQELPDQNDTINTEQELYSEKPMKTQNRGRDNTRNEIRTLSGKNQHSGGYGGLVFKGSEFNDEQILIFGVRGAWIINRSLGIGLDANGIIPMAKYDNIDPEGLEKAFLIGGYGGFLLEPVVWSNQIVHFTFPVSIGAGWLGYIEDWENNWQDEWHYYNGELYDHDVFWYVEPGINVELNVATFFRIGAGISKRFTQNLQLSATPESAFDNLNYGFVLKFGGF